MRTHLACLIIFSSSLPAFAQVTIYYDDSGNITMKELATHYRVANIDTIAKKFIGNVKDYWYNDKLMLDVEAPAEFPGGMQALGDFIGAFLKYPEEAARNNIKGKVIIGFTITENGELMDFKVIQGLGYGCEEEAIRVLKLLPDWVPGYQSGRTVKSQFSLPMAFQ